jgi:hypothetical protein
MLRKAVNWLRYNFTQSRHWPELERFNPNWRERIAIMAKHISQEDGPVADIGCGPMWLKEYLPAGVGYVGVDYTDRGDGCVVCDLNEEPFPNLDAQTYFVSGCLEYIAKPEPFIATISARAQKCILSYCGREHFPHRLEREKLGWRNHLLNSEVADMFAKHGMTLASSELTPSNNAVLVFTQSARTPAAGR